MILSAVIVVFLFYNLTDEMDDEYTKLLEQEIVLAGAIQRITRNSHSYLYILRDIRRTNNQDTIKQLATKWYNSTKGNTLEFSQLFPVLNNDEVVKTNLIRLLSQREKYLNTVNKFIDRKREGLHDSASAYYYQAVRPFFDEYQDSMMSFFDGCNKYTLKKSDSITEKKVHTKNYYLSILLLPVLVLLIISIYMMLFLSKKLTSE